MFKLASKQTFTRDVKVRTPVDGGFRDESFKATFELLKMDDAKTFDMSGSEGITAFLRRVVLRVDEIEDENGNALPYSDELRDRVIGLPHTRGALSQTYFDALAGDPKSGN